MLWFCCVLRAADWPQILGPDRNGQSGETNLAGSWPNEGPRVVWKANVGQGWSGPVVVSNRLYAFHRSGDDETLDCLNATNGRPIWQARYPSEYRDDFGFDEGPRATPASNGRLVVTLGANGMLGAWDSMSGTNLWRVDTRMKFEAGKGFFGVACSPLIEGGRVIVNVGGKDAGIVAFGEADGKVLWKATSEEASYSSPVGATMAGKRRVFVLARRSLIALEPENGRVLWQHPFQPSVSASVSAATPLVVGDRIFISASYGAGGALLRYGETAPVVLWAKEEVLSNHYSTSVHHAGFLFGFDGRQEQRCHLRCVELATGAVRWSEEHFGAGNVLVAGNRLLLITERGELILAPASPDTFKPLARAQILGSDCRAIPALANGLLYARDKRQLVCVDLR